jgi:hypothetical protein
VPDEELRASFAAEMAKVQKYLAIRLWRLTPTMYLSSPRPSGSSTAGRERLLKARTIAAALGYPLHRRADAPATYISPIVRRKLPTTVTTPFDPEPAIEEAEYQNIMCIVCIVENMSL